MTFIEKIGGNGCGCDRLTDGTAPISIDEALTSILRETQMVSQIDIVPLAQAGGRILATPLRSRGMVPPFDNAAMDGYALRSSDLSGDGPWDMEVAGRVAAGHAAPMTVAAHTAVQVFTGAPVPAGADAVVMQEDVVRTANRVRILQNAKPGSHIRKAGEDMGAGKIVLPAGRCLSAREMAICAAGGHGSVDVTRRIRVALLVTGDEVCQPGQSRGPAGIWDVNTPLLSAALDSPEIDFCGAHLAADTRNGLRAQIDDLSQGVDLFVTTGGISVGEEDHVKPALSDLHATIFFSGVALKPGKPVSFGRHGNTYWLGLPGNPLSAFVTWQLFGTTLCAALAGKTPACARRRHVILARALHHRPGRCELRLARLTGFDGAGRECADFPETSQSGRVAQLADMDGLLFIPAEAQSLPEGALVEFQPF